MSWNNGSGHYKPSARDMGRAITIIGSTGDISNLRAAVLIGIFDGHKQYYYFPAAQLQANSPNELKTGWGQVQRKIIVSGDQYREIYRTNPGTVPIPFDQLEQEYSQQTQRLAGEITMFPFDYN